jgi:hypothetical protein
MKKRISHIILYILSLQILLASIGISLYTRHCSMPDMEDEISLFAQPTKCCEKDHENHRKPCSKPQKKPVNPCCEFSSAYLNVNFERVEVNNTFKASSKVLVLHTNSLQSSYISNYLSFVPEKIPIDFSPPPSGKQILILHQIWRV